MNHLAIIFSALLAIFATQHGPLTKIKGILSGKFTRQQQNTISPSFSSVYVIGDLHGDVICAISWVNRTGLVNNLLDPSLVSDQSLALDQRLNPPSKWSWSNDESSLVFMGDYVDKGPTSKQTVQFVRDLTLQFPERVTALLGNHELELLRDRDARITPHGRYSSYSYASVHPGEYHNYFLSSSDGHWKTSDDNPRSLDSKDEKVLNLLYEASIEVYSFGAHNQVRFAPSVPASNNNQQALYAITDIIPPEHRTLAKERLEEYQEAYLNSYRTGTTLGSWLESRPIVHFAENINTLFVHGGVHPNIGSGYFDNGKESVDNLNSIWNMHSMEEKLFDFLDNTSMGEVVYSLLTYRGNHPGYSKWESHGQADDNPSDEDAVCVELKSMLTDISGSGINRIAVGHTPDFNVRMYCNDTFLALDSMLGRGIRTTGNEYCPWHGHEGVSKVSRNGRYKCDEVPESCHGETVRLESDGSITILNL